VKSYIALHGFKKFLYFQEVAVKNIHPAIWTKGYRLEKYSPVSRKKMKLQLI